jgi:hypothetical protein
MLPFTPVGSVIRTATTAKNATTPARFVTLRVDEVVTTSVSTKRP